MTGKDISEARGTLSRWSSEPTSLSSGSGGGDDTSPDLLERSRRLVATLRRTLAAERDRCRRLEAQQTTFASPSGLDAILRCVDQERCENRQLHCTILRQHRTIAKLRRQLRSVQCPVDGCSTASDDNGDVDDDSVTDFDIVCGRPDCDGCTANNCYRKVRRRQNIVTLYMSTIWELCVAIRTQGCPHV